MHKMLENSVHLPLEYVIIRYNGTCLFLTLYSSELSYIFIFIFLIMYSMKRRNYIVFILHYMYNQHQQPQPNRGILFLTCDSIERGEHKNICRRKGM
jgi:hypothetical protein